MTNVHTREKRKYRLPLVRNVRQQMDGLAMLQRLPSGCASVVTFDPQYRTILDEMGYGNEGENRERKRAALKPMSEATIALFVKEIERVLKPSGHLFLWVDKFIAAEGHHVAFFSKAPNLKRVDFFCWNKLRIGMGRRGRCTSEYLSIAQKKPIRAKDIWLDNSIPDCWLEHSDRSRHPHAKPHQLTERLIRAVTLRGDLIVDPCAGSYGTLDACIASGRQFVGCDLEP